MRRFRARVVLALLAVCLAPLPALPARAADDRPLVSGPIPVGIGVPTRARPFGSSLFDLAPYGYVEREYFIEGSAAAPGRPALPYRTRLVVRSPADPVRFNGAVVLEWQNVTMGWDIEATWIQAHTMLLREGYAWVGVSAQKVSVDTGPTSLRMWDPVRYGTLVHPGDDYSFAIFAGAAAAVRGAASGVDPMRGEVGRADVGRLLAVGTSQSADRLTTLMNDHPGLAERFDGVMIRAGGGPLREDPAVPVLRYETESEVEGSPDTRQDLPHMVLWEVAGSAHFNQRSLDYAFGSAGRDFGGVPLRLTRSCGVNEPNRFPDHYSEMAAVRALDRWAARGDRPAEPDLLTTDAGGSIMRDADGNALGGLRLPAIAVPTARHSGASLPCTGLLSLLGSSTDMTRERILELHPTHQGYVADVERAARAAHREGVLLAADVDEILLDADRYDVWDAPEPGSARSAS